MKSFLEYRKQKLSETIETPEVIEEELKPRERLEAQRMAEGGQPYCRRKS